MTQQSLAEELADLALDPDEEAAINQLVLELKLSRSKVLHTIVRDWLISNARLRADEIGENSETDENA